MTPTLDITVVGYGGHRGRLVHQTIGPHKRRSVYDWLSGQSRRLEDQICNNQSPVVFHEHNVREPDIGGLRGHFYGMPLVAKPLARRTLVQVRGHDPLEIEKS